LAQLRLSKRLEQVMWLGGLVEPEQYVRGGVRNDADSKGAGVNRHGVPLCGM
jgi:hypothetical protein